MYIDCEKCGFESECFVILGCNFNEQAVAKAKENGCTCTVNPNGSLSFQCPQGHAADLFPTELKFKKR